MKMLNFNDSVEPGNLKLILFNFIIIHLTVIMDNFDNRGFKYVDL